MLAALSFLARLVGGLFLVLAVAWCLHGPYFCLGGLRPRLSGDLPQAGVEDSVCSVVTACAARLRCSLWRDIGSGVCSAPLQYEAKTQAGVSGNT